jgi:hypothetical protein
MGLIVIYNRSGIHDAFIIDDIVEADAEAGRLWEALQGTGTRVELVYLS